MSHFSIINSSRIHLYTLYSIDVIINKLITEFYYKSVNLHST